MIAFIIGRQCESRKADGMIKKLVTCCPDTDHALIDRDSFPALSPLTALDASWKISKKIYTKINLYCNSNFLINFET